MNGFRPKLNSRGDVVSGLGEVWLNNQPLAMPGWNPQFRTDGKVVYIGTQDGQLFDVPASGGTPVGRLEKVSHFAAGADRVIAPGAGEVAISIDPSTGSVVKVIEHNGSNLDHSITVNDVPVISHEPVTDVRMADGLLVYSHWTGKPHDRGTKGIDPQGQSHDLRVFQAGWEGSPVPFSANGEPWVMFMTNEDIRLHPWGSAQGYIIRAGEDRNLTPDARFINNVIQVVWSDAQGNLGRRSIALSDPREDLTGVVVSTPPPPPPPPDKPKDPTVPEIPNHAADVAQIRAHYPTPLGFVHWAFLVEVAQFIGAQLYRKEDSNSVLIPALGKRVSLDVIGRGSMGNHWADILGDSENLAIPNWDVHVGAEGEYVDVSGVKLPGQEPKPDEPKNPPPPPPPPPPSDCGEKLDAAVAPLVVLLTSVSEELATVKRQVEANGGYASEIKLQLSKGYIGTGRFGMNIALDIKPKD